MRQVRKKSRLPWRWNLRPAWARHGERKPRLSLRGISFTLSGKEGRPWRIALGFLCGLLLLFLLIRVFQVEPQLASSPEVETIRARGVLRVGVRTDVPGMGEDGAGFEVELAQLIAARMLPDIPAGNSCKLVEVNAMNIGPKFTDDSIDVAVAMMPRGVSSNYAYSQAYYTDPCYFVTAPDAQRLVLQNVTIGVVQNTPCATILDAYILERPSAGLTAVKYASYPDMLQALRKGTVNLALLRETYINKYKTATRTDPTTLIEYYLYDFRVSGISPGSISYAVTAPAETANLAAYADMLLNEMRADGTLQGLYTKYGFEAQYAHEEENSQTK